MRTNEEVMEELMALRDVVRKNAETISDLQELNKVLRAESVSQAIIIEALITHIKQLSK